MKTTYEMTRNVLDRKHDFEKKRQTKRRISLSVFAAVFVCGAVFLAVKGNLSPEVLPPQTDACETVSQTGSPDSSGINSVFEQGKNESGKTFGYKQLISLKDNGDNACYAAPANGIVYQSYPLSQALEKYGDNARYRIEIHFFREKNLLDSDSPEVKEIVDKISSQLIREYGVGLSVITYKDIDGNTITEVTHDGAEKELIENFPVSENYGCFLWLYSGEMTDDTGSVGVNNGGFVSADCVAVLRHNNKLYCETESVWFSEKPLTSEERPISEFEAFEKNNIGNFIGVAKNDVDLCIGGIGKKTFDNELSSDIDGEVYTVKGTAESEELYIINQTDYGYLVIKLIAENHNHQLNWWYAPALQGHNTGSTLKSHRKIRQSHFTYRPPLKRPFLMPWYSCYP